MASKVIAVVIDRGAFDTLWSLWGDLSKGVNAMIAGNATLVMAAVIFGVFVSLGFICIRVIFFDAQNQSHIRCFNAGR
jgi:hypothetical protein